MLQKHQHEHDIKSTNPNPPSLFFQIPPKQNLTGILTSTKTGTLSPHQCRSQLRTRRMKFQPLPHRTLQRTSLHPQLCNHPTPHTTSNKNLGRHHTLWPTTVHLPRLSRRPETGQHPSACRGKSDDTAQDRYAGTAGFSVKIVCR